MSVQLNSILAPEAVLEDEDNEEEDARAEGGGTEAGEGIGQRVLESLDAGICRYTVRDAFGDAEVGVLANTSAIVGSFKELDEVLDPLPVVRLSDLIGEGAEGN